MMHSTHLGGIECDSGWSLLPDTLLETFRKALNCAALQCSEVAPSSLWNVTSHVTLEKEGPSLSTEQLAVCTLRPVTSIPWLLPTSTHAYNLAFLLGTNNGQSDHDGSLLSHGVSAHWVLTTRAQTILLVVGSILAPSM